MTREELQKMGDDACVQMALRPAYTHTGDRLDPRLWEDLRQEVQRRLRRATGEQYAIVTFSFGQEAA